ncbi:MAG TPA: hypothetical protein VHH36_08095 [Candidatus Thermoplasmatota archaeon]|nr:hypothetical protein [Candidatus Thermoplasmatota archaeon]
MGVADTEYGPWPYSLVGATIEFEAASQSYAGRPYTMGFSDVARTPLVTL